MELEKEIKQTKFQTDYQKLWLNLIYTANWLQNSTAKLLKKYNLTEPQYNILRILRGQNGKPISVLDIQSRMLDKMSNASRLIEKLRIKGYVERNENSEDRRQVDITITDKGLELLKELDPIIKNEENRFKHLSSEEIRTINTFLDKLRG